MKKKIFLIGCGILLMTSAFILKFQEEKVESTLEVYDLETKQRSVVYKTDEHFEAPNWSRDGKFLVYNSNGKIYKFSFGGKPELINTGFATKCNNDHGISPDNSHLVISHHESKTGKSIIYTCPLTGGLPVAVTPIGPSYWHGWSPDGKTLAYCAERNGEFDIYSIPVSGGKETRLTNAAGLDDGPDYSYDGKYIYFNSVRTGKMKIWRMKPDGSEQSQMTFDEYNDWFPHPSPDGKWMVFVSYDKDVDGHPANKNVRLRLMPLSGGKPEVLAELFGGQGTINVPSWSPDSKKFAFVSYKLQNK
ncbi:MAG: PD40 domain-containing protein [Sporocytophaga sp.]|uniref:TolB family protein n=1 Tax=Sporocytophaga sp. TaxID=2231183 RepID=UPI001B0D8B66|nr:transporter [Sporocytophaga sp.]MBO9698860.1 PD40 domain-containing protein [Sporocytophaga sp.]